MGAGLQIFDSVGRSIFDSSTSRIPLVFGKISFTAPYVKNWHYQSSGLYTHTHSDARLNDSVFKENRFFIIGIHETTNNHQIHSFTKDSTGKIVINTYKTGARFEFLYGVL